MNRVGQTSLEEKKSGPGDHGAKVEPGAKWDGRRSVQPARLPFSVRGVWEGAYAKQLRSRNLGESKDARRACLPGKQVESAGPPDGSSGVPGIRWPWHVSQTIRFKNARVKLTCRTPRFILTSWIRPARISWESNLDRCNKQTFLARQDYIFLYNRPILRNSADQERWRSCSTPQYRRYCMYIFASVKMRNYGEVFNLLASGRRQPAGSTPTPAS
jgi:hypothetical protein